MTLRMLVTIQTPTSDEDGVSFVHTFDDGFIPPDTPTTVTGTGSCRPLPVSLSSYHRQWVLSAATGTVKPEAGGMSTTSVSRLVVASAGS